MSKAVLKPSQAQLAKLISRVPRWKHLAELPDEVCEYLVELAQAVRGDGLIPIQAKCNLDKLAAMKRSEVLKAFYDMKQAEEEIATVVRHLTRPDYVGACIMETFRVPHSDGPESYSVYRKANRKPIPRQCLGVSVAAFEIMLRQRKIAQGENHPEFGPRWFLVAQED